MVSPDGKILDINQSALNALGYKKEEILGKPISTIYSPESQQKMKELFENWKETGKLINKEIEIISKNSEKCQVLLSAHAVKDKEGNILHSISVQRDITERTVFLNSIFKGQKDADKLITVMDSWKRIDLPTTKEIQKYYETHYGKPR